MEKIGCSEYRVLKGTRVSNRLMTPKSDCILHPVDFLRVHQSYQKAIYKDGIPSTMFFVDDLNVEFERLTSLGVNFKSEPTEMGGVKIAVFDDTCGNLISLCQQ